MLNILYHHFGTKLLNKIDPEISHAIALCSLRLLNQFVKKKEISASILKTQIAGMEMPSPIGLAAGFDKNAEVFNATPPWVLGLWKLVQLLQIHNSAIPNHVYLDF